MPLACVLFSDITGSTGLYEQGNRLALDHVSKVLARMREIVEAAGGECVKSQGDDVLSFFRDPEAAFQAAWAMIEEDWPGGLSVHAGAYHGEILSHENDIYGSAVNTAARLCSLAKPGEILLGDESYDRLGPDARARLQLIGEIRLRGKAGPTRVYSCAAMSLAEQTTVFPGAAAKRSGGTEYADIRFADQSWQIAEGESLTVGRAQDCDIVVDQAWVSRKHAVLSVTRWQLEIKDHSSLGCVIELADGGEVLLHRRATLLNGSGAIFLGPRSHVDGASRLYFETHELALENALG